MINRDTRLHSDNKLVCETEVVGKDFKEVWIKKEQFVVEGVNKTQPVSMEALLNMPSHA